MVSGRRTVMKCQEHNPVVQCLSRLQKTDADITNWRNAIQSMAVTFIALQRPCLSIFQNKFPRISQAFARKRAQAGRLPANYPF